MAKRPSAPHGTAGVARVARKELEAALRQHLATELPSHQVDLLVARVFAAGADQDEPTARRALDAAREALLELASVWPPLSAPDWHRWRARPFEVWEWPPDDLPNELAVLGIQAINLEKQLRRARWLFTHKNASPGTRARAAQLIRTLHTAATGWGLPLDKREPRDQRLMLIAHIESEARRLRSDARSIAKEGHSTMAGALRKLGVDRIGWSGLMVLRGLGSAYPALVPPSLLSDRARNKPSKGDVALIRMAGAAVEAWMRRSKGGRVPAGKKALWPTVFALVQGLGIAPHSKNFLREEWQEFERRRSPFGKQRGEQKAPR